MHGGNALAKGQAHTAAALLAGAGFIHHVKRLGHAGQLIRRDAAAVVLHGQRHGVPGIGQQHRDGHSCRAGLGGILHQVAQQVQQQVRIAVYHSPALGRQQRHLGAGHPQPRP